MKLAKIAFVLLLSCLSLSLYAQNTNITPTIEPQFFGADDEITITYDVTGTALSNLNDAWLWAWLPGVSNGDAPSNINPANSNTSATDPAKLTKSVESGRTYFRIILTPTSFYNRSAEEISTLGMLLKGNDWSDGQSVDYTVEISEGFSLRVDAPTSSIGFYDAGESILFEAITSETANFTLSLDGIIIENQENTTQFSATHQAIDDGQIHVLTLSAFRNTDEASFTHTYAIEPDTELAPLPSGLEDGINYDTNDATKATLVLRAPNKQHVFVIGDFNNWSLSADYLMKKDGDQFWLEINGLEAGKEYIFQYLVDGAIRIADPYAEKVSSPYDDGQIISENRYPGLLPYPEGKTEHEAAYLQTARDEFVWTATEYERPAKEDLIIYELLVRDFTEERTYQAVIDRLDYLETLGVNAIELMPVMEFEGNLSWGYNPSFKLAVDKFYGTENDLKRLIDECHKRGMAVILDIVLNHHFGRSPLVRLYNDAPYGAPTNDNPWLNRNARHDFNVGYDFNHERALTQYYVDRVNQYWIEEYNIDGYRFDLSKGFTQRNTIGNVGAWGNYDASRVALLKRMADQIWAVDPDNYVILEHFADNNEEVELANYGMMLWGNMHNAYINAARGSQQNLNWAYHRSRGWEQANLVAYMESHDEERQLFEVVRRSGGSAEDYFQQLKLNAAFFFMIPGPKMLWQFGEFGYDLELNNDRLGIKPTRWEYLDDPERKKLFDVYSSLINLRTKTPYVQEEYFSWKSDGYVKYMHIKHPEVQISVIGNFNDEVEASPSYFISNGTWYNYFTGEEKVVTDFQNDSTRLSPGEFRIYTSEPLDNFIENGQDVILQAETELNDLTDFRLYPMPANDQLHIVPSDGSEILGVDILTINGKRLQERQLIEGQINVADLPKGIYLLSIKHAKGQTNKRLIIK